VTDQADEGFASDEVVYRRLAHGRVEFVSTDALTGERRPSSGAFRPDEDGVSIYRDAKLRDSGLGPQDILTKPENLVVSLEVQDIRAIVPLDVKDDPWPADIPEPGHPRNGAHALITGWDGLSKGERLKRQKALTVVKSLKFVVFDS